ncbi:putative tetrapyrrole methylase, subdomain 1 [Helianthus anomalus]
MIRGLLKNCMGSRLMVEEKVDDMLLEAREFDVAFLVVGDPFG